VIRQLWTGENVSYQGKRHHRQWRFTVKAWKNLYNLESPVEIQQKAAAGTPLGEVMKSWPVGSDPAVHIRKMHELYDVHSGQPDQARVIEL